MTDAPQQPPAPAEPQPQPAAPPPAATQDYTMGWLAHLLAIFTWFIGPLIIWLVKKDDDKYAAYHGKQALCWVVALTIVMIVLWVLSILLVFAAGPIAFVTMCAMQLVGLGNLAYVIYAIVQTAKGKPFKYFFVADKFCAKEFAEAYPGQAAGAPPA